jgi:hypothetical protein
MISLFVITAEQMALEAWVVSSAVEMQEHQLYSSTDVVLRIRNNYTGLLSEEEILILMPMKKEPLKWIEDGERVKFDLALWFD